jgi:hypothetical protein
LNVSAFIEAPPEAGMVWVITCTTVVAAPVYATVGAFVGAVDVATVGAAVGAVVGVVGAVDEAMEVGGALTEGVEAVGTVVGASDVFD